MSRSDDEEVGLTSPLPSPRKKNKSKRGKCNSLAAACAGAVVLAAGVVPLAWGELVYSCQYRGVFLAEIEARPLDCNSTDVLEEFVFLSCPLDFSSFTVFTPATFNVAMNHSAPIATSIRFGSSVGQQITEMYQCVETKNDAGVYNYSMAWRASPMDNGGVHFENDNWLDESSTVCLGLTVNGNPRWPTNLAEGTETERDNMVRAGSFNLTGELMESFEIDGDVILTEFATNFGEWSDPVIDPVNGIGEVNTSNVKVGMNGLALVSCEGLRAGCVRVSYKMAKTNWASAFTHIGAGQTTRAQTTPASWTCAEGSYQHLQASNSLQLTKAELIESEVGRFDGLASQSDNTLRRVVCSVLIWLGVFLLLQPLFDASEAWGNCLKCIPCCGSTLMNVSEGAVSCVICVFSLLCGASITLIVAAVVWVHIRPWMSAWMSSLVILLCLCSCICIQIAPQKKRVPDSARSLSGSGEEWSDEDDGTAID